MGKAVVSTSIGAEGLEVTQGENILITDQPTEFANYVIILMSDTHFRNRIGSNGRQLVKKKYDWRPIVSSLLEALRNRLPGGRGAKEFISRYTKMATPSPISLKKQASL
jgi:glycosyltransferase involved in cell wall biosynthesis